MKEFKVGDRIRVIKRTDHDFKNLVGQVGTIVKILDNKSTPYAVKMDHPSFNYSCQLNNKIYRVYPGLLREDQMEMIADFKSLLQDEDLITFRNGEQGIAIINSIFEIVIHTNGKNIYHLSKMNDDLTSNFDPSYDIVKIERNNEIVWTREVNKEFTKEELEIVEIQNEIIELEKRIVELQTKLKEKDLNKNSAGLDKGFIWKVFNLANK